MKRFTMLAAAAFVLVGSIGCQHHRCQECGPKAGGGLLGRLGGGLGHHGACNVATGCRACKLGWQHGGHDYSEGLATWHPSHSFPGRQSGPYGGGMAGGGMGGGMVGGGLGGGMAGAMGHHGAAPGQYGPAGPPTAGVAYPYYTTRGPRDFLQDNPPSIGR